MELQNVDVLPQVPVKTKQKLSFSKKAFVVVMAIALPAISTASNAAVDLGIDGEELKTLILGLIATIALLGTAYLTVLVATSAFSLIRRVIRG